MDKAKVKEAIEAIIDIRDVCENRDLAYVYKKNGGIERLNNVIDCLRILEDIIHVME